MRCQSSAFNSGIAANGPLDFAKVTTMGVGDTKTWTRTYPRQRQAQQPMSLLDQTTTPRMLPYQRIAATDSYNNSLDGFQNVPAESMNKGGHMKMLWMPYIEDVAEGSSPIQLRCAMTMETKIMARVYMAQVHQDGLSAANVSATGSVHSFNQVGGQRIQTSGATNVIEGNIDYGQYF